MENPWSREGGGWFWIPALFLGALAGCSDDEASASSGLAGGDPGSGGAGTTTTTSASTGGQGGGGGDTGATTGPGGGGSGGGYEGSCTPLTLGDTSIFFQSIARSALQAPVAPGVSELASTRLTMELYDYNFDTGAPLPELVPGTYEFATPPDDNYGTCQHCVLLVAYDLAGAPKRAFYPRNGTFELEELGLDFPSYVIGRVDDVELVEVIQNEDFTWEVLPGGDCFHVDTWSFDTFPVDGGACSSVEECPHEGLQICEPQSGECGAPQCDLFGDVLCPEGEVCLSQVFDPGDSPYGPAIGACYERCDPADPASCGEDRECRPLGLTQSFGACYVTGTAPVGAECTARDISTECEPGAVCKGEPGECARVCEFLQPEAGCDPDRHCTFSNLCEPAGVGDAAAIGELCASSSPEAVECGIEGDAFRGLCVRWYPDQIEMTCERLCRTEDPACPDGEVCLGLFDDPRLGLCQPPAVCGDGELDLIGGELCDDGNEVAGDGCAADCRAAELDALCAQASPMGEDTDVTGTTVGGPTGYPSQCDPYVGVRVATHSYLPPGPGELRLSLETEVDLKLSVYGECADPSTELACQWDAGEGDLVVEIASAPTEPVLVIVRGSSPLHEGAYLLRADFTPAE